MLGYLKTSVCSAGFTWAPRLWVLTPAMLCGLLALPSTARAQLRSGRSSRPLYQQGLAEEARAQSARTSELAMASFEDEPDAVIVSGQPRNAVRNDSNLMQSTFEPQLVSGAGCDCDMCSGGGCGDTSCDGLGCNSGCSDRSLLAPAATSFCAPECGPLMRFWCGLRIRTEIPMYWRRGHGPPPLITTSPLGTPADTAGQLGENTTSILLGNSVTNEDVSAGFRLTLSTWLGADQQNELMFRVWTAGDQNDNYAFQSGQFPILARPFLNTTDPTAPEQDTQLIAYPNQSIGGASVNLTNSVSGFELTLKRLCYEDRFTRIDWMYGYQYLKIDDGLSIFSLTEVTGNVPPLQGSRISVADVFEAHNDFNGVTYGMMSSRTFGMWDMETMFRLGAGNLRRRAIVSGSSRTVSGGTTTTDNEGLLARRTNSRNVTNDTFIVVPEVGINLAYRIRPGFDFNIGYNYLLVPKAMRAAKLIDSDLAVNLSDPLVGSLDPGLQLNEEKFWLHSLGFGFQLHY